MSDEFFGGLAQGTGRSFGPTLAQNKRLDFARDQAEAQERRFNTEEANRVFREREAHNERRGAENRARDERASDRSLALDQRQIDLEQGVRDRAENTRRFELGQIDKEQGRLLIRERDANVAHERRLDRIEDTARFEKTEKRLLAGQKQQGKQLDLLVKRFEEDTRRNRTDEAFRSKNAVVGYALKLAELNNLDERRKNEFMDAAQLQLAVLNLRGRSDINKSMLRAKADDADMKALEPAARQAIAELDALSMGALRALEEGRVEEGSALAGRAGERLALLNSIFAGSGTNDEKFAEAINALLQVRQEEDALEAATGVPAPPPLHRRGAPNFSQFDTEPSQLLRRR